MAGHDTYAHLQSVQEREQKRLEVEKKARLYSKDTGAQTLATTSPWMERTRWPTTYHDIRRDILQRMTWMPDLRCLEFDHHIGRGLDDADPDIFSPWQDEHKIGYLTAAIDWVLDRCEETMRHTSRSLLCWLRSTRPHICYPKPFTLVALKKSQKKYRQLWMRFLAFIFRLFRMPVSLRGHVAKIRFTKDQLGQLQAIWEHEALNDARLILTSSNRVIDDKEEQEEVGEEDVEEDEGDLDEGEEHGMMKTSKMAMISPMPQMMTLRKG